MTSLMIIPSELLPNIALFAIRARNLSAWNVISKEFRAVASQFDEAISEVEFRDRDPIIYASLSSASGDGRATWKERLQRLIELRKKVSEQTPLRGYSTCDMVLHKHPSNGFQLRLGLVRGVVVVHSLRKIPGFVSAAETFLGPLGIPVRAQTTSNSPGEAEPEGGSVRLGLVRGVVVVHSLRKIPGFVSAAEIFLGPLGIPAAQTTSNSPGEAEPAGGSAVMDLVIVSIDGSKVSDFSTFESYFDEINGAGGELSHWRFICIPRTHSDEGVSSLPSEFLLAPPVLPRHALELRRLRQGLEVTDDDSEVGEVVG
eukprot:CAMPEP_0172646406 /NCGR_PEP_ID=MMETSP1068-20121228/240223_1 /TAXON_ID=35684 /ORGANISM="Pseudopedinella elastica, Strain CCMP716" /LENGTH=313 /DNA_ID=CAMNT_0013460663 /DNA_START=110 /DNA_END=1052 /DNA_ORIENTATION=-